MASTDRIDKRVDFFYKKKRKYRRSWWNSWTFANEAALSLPNGKCRALAELTKELNVWKEIAFWTSGKCRVLAELTKELDIWTSWQSMPSIGGVEERDETLKSNCLRLTSRKIPNISGVDETVEPFEKKLFSHDLAKKVEHWPNWWTRKHDEKRWTRRKWSRWKCWQKSEILTKNVLKTRKHNWSHFQAAIGF